jgi:hypothetical protein
MPLPLPSITTFLLPSPPAKDSSCDLSPELDWDDTSFVRKRDGAELGYSPGPVCVDAIEPVDYEDILVTGLGLFKIVMRIGGHLGALAAREAVLKSLLLDATGSALKKEDSYHHRVVVTCGYMKDMADHGKHFVFRGKDGAKYRLTQMLGQCKHDKEGVFFEVINIIIIINSSGVRTHQRFITGKGALPESLIDAVTILCSQHEASFFISIIWPMMSYQTMYFACHNQVCNVSSFSNH